MRIFPQRNRGNLGGAVDGNTEEISHCLVGRLAAHIESEEISTDGQGTESFPRWLGLLNTHS